MPDKGLYIQLFSIHGLVRYHNMELGRDADTGGQIKYVVELAEHLSRMKNVRRVDLITRLIEDKRVSKDYSVPFERINDKFNIVRIQCGGQKHFRKELLWQSVDEFVDKTITFTRKQNDIPQIVHGHYADAGYVAMMLAKYFKIPFVSTGHSLGRPKLQKLLEEGLKQDDIVKRFKIDKRIAVEESILSASDLIITSTRQEASEQYGLYDNGTIAQFRVIPPGLDLKKFYPYYQVELTDPEANTLKKYTNASLKETLNRFLLQPKKPLILSLCRPEKRKNISGLITAYGKDLNLQSMANLAIFAGIRKDIATMEENERDVLTEILLLMDKYDLYGKIAIPKRHNFEDEVPELYRIVAEKKGVFVNPALTEPFGLTLIEASASGLPIVATNDGGPKDIIKHCKNGILIDASDPESISNAIKHIISDSSVWKQFSKNGVVNVRKQYTWKAHAERYLDEVGKIISKHPGSADESIAERIFSVDRFLITDIDNTLIGEKNSRLPEFISMIEKNRDFSGFGVATGRSIESTVGVLDEFKIPYPDIIVTSVGSEIYYGKDLFPDKGWEEHISRSWNKTKIEQLLGQFSFLSQQNEDPERKYKLSYYMAPDEEHLTYIHNTLLTHRCRYNLIYSHEKYLDILPYRASKGKAIRYLSRKWDIPIKQFLVCGDSGNDEEMLRGASLAAVVGNYSCELEKLKGRKNIFFTDKCCASGILEAVERYKFFS